MEFGAVQIAERAGARQPDGDWSGSAIMNGRVRRHLFTLGVPLLTELINITILAGLLVLLHIHGWKFASAYDLPTIALIIFVLPLVALPGMGGAVWENATLRLNGPANDNLSSSNDNLRAKPEPGMELADTLRRSRSAFLGVGLLSCLINILMLTGPLFMLQVYDRVLPSHSIPTLLGLAVLVAGLFLFQGILDAIRSRVLLRIGGAVNDEMSARAYDTVARLPLRTRGGGDGLQPIRDLDQIRSFLSSPGPSALFDLPWMPFYVGICFLFHPLIGIAATFGAFFLGSLTVAAEAVTRRPAKAAALFASTRQVLLEASRRNAEVMQAMGMRGTMSARFAVINDDYLRSHRHASDRAGLLAALSRVMRLVLQSLVLGLGAYLVINQEATAGVIIASSILMSRALAPVELAIANWKGFVAARQARRRLSELLAILPHGKQSLPLPKPESALSVESVSASPPGSQRIVLQDVSFALNSGVGLGIIGPSAAGKSSLARLIVGVWPPVRGKVRLDGAALDQWSPEALGRHIGYLPQDVELFDGTIAENISRFEVEPDVNSLIAAAKSAGVHDLVVRLPEGYDTRIGEAGATLSAGQRQRVALARALYRDPFLVVLDEPNSNLDSEGEEALTVAIRRVRSRGGVAVVIAHRASVLAAVDQVLVLNQGRQQALGPRDEVLRTVLRPTAVQPLTVVATASGNP
jgi:PrtD family type I secretion system ABC transporter